MAYHWPFNFLLFPPVFGTRMTKLGMCSSGGIWLFGELCEQLRWQLYRWLFMHCGVNLSFYLLDICDLEELACWCISLLEYPFKAKLYAAALKIHCFMNQTQIKNMQMFIYKVVFKGLDAWISSSLKTLLFVFRKTDIVLVAKYFPTSNLSANTWKRNC